MFRELRAWNPDIPESPDRMDPVMRLLLQLYANQISKIDRRMDQVWDVAVSSLIRSVCPESQRWPVPAYTVLTSELADPVVHVDTDTRFFYKEAREGGRTFFFTPQRPEKLLSAAVRWVLLRAGDKIVPVTRPPDLDKAGPVMYLGGGLYLTSSKDTVRHFEHTDY